jgi:hypothetical protein
VTELDRERFTLTAPPPVRSFAVAALMAVVGAALMVGSRALGLGTVVLVLGIVMLGLAAALVVAAVILVGRLRCTLVLDPAGIAVSRGRRTQRLPWSNIDAVRLTRRRLTFVTKPAVGAEMSVINPRGDTDPTFRSLVAAIRSRLNASRGYRTS